MANKTNPPFPCNERAGCKINLFFRLFAGCFRFGMPQQGDGGGVDQNGTEQHDGDPNGIHCYHQHNTGHQHHSTQCEQKPAEQAQPMRAHSANR